MTLPYVQAAAEVVHYPHGRALPPACRENCRVPHDPALERDSERLFAQVFTIVLEGEKRLAEHLAAQGLTAPQFYVLKTLIESGGQMGIGEIARRHGLTNATMTGLVSRMERFAPPLVVRAADQTDRRAVVVGITPAGEARFRGVQASLLDQLRAVFGLLPAEERCRLLDELERYSQIILAAGAPASR
jgi:DNA-binding MarR family transcriptional regulator